jgi:hypothetical protein
LLLELELDLALLILALERLLLVLELDLELELDLLLLDLDRLLLKRLLLGLYIIISSDDPSEGDSYNRLKKPGCTYLTCMSATPVGEYSSSITS